MSLSVTMISRQIIPYDMVTTDSVLDVKKRVALKEKIDSHLVILNFGDKELHDESSLAEIRDMAHSNQVSLVAKERDEISIQMPNGDIVQLEMEPTDTILNVKEHLQQKEGIEAKLLRLFF